MGGGMSLYRRRLAGAIVAAALLAVPAIAFAAFPNGWRVISSGGRQYEGLEGPPVEGGFFIERHIGARSSAQVQIHVPFRAALAGDRYCIKGDDVRVAHGVSEILEEGGKLHLNVPLMPQKKLFNHPDFCAVRASGTPATKHAKDHKGLMTLKIYARDK